jgi:hypothetical protein
MPGYTKLDAVNRMLAAAGEQPVNTLVSDGTNDVSLAESILEDSTLEILSQGLNFNTEVKELAVDSNGKVSLADTILSFSPWGEDAWRKLTQRGKYLYDLSENRNTFPNDDVIVLKITYNWDYDDIPTDIQLWIADHAARVYQMQTQRSREMDAFLAERELKSQAKARSSDARNRNANYNRNFNGNTGWGTVRNRFRLRGPQ